MSEIWWIHHVRDKSLSINIHFIRFRLQVTSSFSTENKLIFAAWFILYFIRDTRVKLAENQCVQGPLRLVSRHIARAIHWWSLERTGPDPLRNWAPDTLSHHVLLALDELLRALKCQNLRCYFQQRCNLMLQCARGNEQSTPASNFNDPFGLLLYRTLYVGLACTCTSLYSSLLFHASYSTSRSEAFRLFGPYY